MSWTEDTENQVDFIIKALNLKGNERILDLACGYGRHALSLARRGYEVVGVDITKCYVEDANKTAKAEGLSASFIQSDIREVTYNNEFDVVLNLADGAIGYLENDEENLKIFDVVARALKPGGKHLMDVCNAEHADFNFPRCNWEMGEKAIALSEFEWDKEKRIMLFGGFDIPYGEPAKKPDILYGDPTRLYTLDEIKTIMSERGMEVKSSYCDYYGSPSTFRELQLIVCSEKR